MTATRAIDAAVLDQAISSLNQAVGWVESGTPGDLREAAEIVNHVLDDLGVVRDGASP